MTEELLQSSTPIEENQAPAAAAATGAAAAAAVTADAAACGCTAADAAAADGSTASSGTADGAAADDAESSDNRKHQRVRSFVIRAGRMTTAQTRALTELSSKYLIDVSDLKPLDPVAAFGRQAPLVVEIGFGMGKSFIQMAKADPDSNYLGIEVHPPGVGACMLTAEEEGVTNVKVIKHDAFEVLTRCLQPESIDILQIFFPDPWPKARHHKRRLINDDFLKLVTPLLRHGGHIRMATDWQEYAEQMLECLNRAEGLSNTNPNGGYIPRPEWRPLTKFEQRGERLGHGVWDLVFSRD